MTTPRDDVLRQSAAMERVQDLAHAHGFDADADAQHAIFVALLAYAGEERDAGVSALVTEYAACLAQRGAWDRPWLPEDAARKSGYYGGARHALERLAERLGVTDLHARAAELVASEESS